MKNRKILTLAQRCVAIGTMGLVLANLSFAQEFTRISPEGIGAQAYDVNESGMVVGVSFNLFENAKRATAWDSMNNVIPLGGNFIDSAALAVNDSGVAVGFGCNIDGKRLPIKWVGGQPFEMANLGHGGQVNDINNLGEATGYVIANGGYYPAKWSADGTLSLLQENGQPARLYSQGLSINESGLLGVQFDSLQYPNVGQLLQGTQIVPRFAEGAELLGVTAINNSGSATGFSYFNSLYDGNAAFQWTPEGMATRLNSVGTQQGVRAFCINDAGIVGGYSQNGLSATTYNTLGTFWINGVGMFVNQPDGSSVTIKGINDSGTAVGFVYTQMEVCAAKWTVPGVIPPNPISLRPTISAMPGQTIQIVANVTNLNPVSDRLVEFRFNNTSLGFLRTDGAGVASMSYTVPLTTGSGSHQVMASLGGSNYKIESQEIRKAPTSIRTMVTYPSSTTIRIDATVQNTAVNRALTGQKVSFNIAGKEYTALTNSSGWARVVVPADRGMRSRPSYRVEFLGNSGHTGSIFKN